MGHEFWFKPKTYGYGATPITWEGWAVTAVFGVVIAACVLAMILRKESLSVAVWSTAVIVVATIALVFVSVKKTDGAWGWNAGAGEIDGKSS